MTRGCLSAALPRFHARYPDIDLDVGDFQSVYTAGTAGVDVICAVGWGGPADFVQRRVLASRFLIAAAPHY